MEKRGSVRVAKYYPGKPEPKTPGYRNVLIHTSPTTLGGQLSPYVLKDENGYLLENIWQFAKVYPSIPAQRIPLSKRYHPGVIIWEYEAQKHLNEDGSVNEDYWKWRRAGMRNEKAVRYPAGFHNRHNCVYALWEDEQLDYIESRKKIYCGEYIRLAPHVPHFRTLKDMLERGINLQIVEVDGPDPNLNFAPYDQISKNNPGLLITEEVIRLLINDERKPFGHGYVIAALLLGGGEWMK